MWMVLSCVIWRLARRLESNLGQRVSRVKSGNCSTSHRKSAIKEPSCCIEWADRTWDSTSEDIFIDALDMTKRPEVRILGEPKWLQARHAEAWHKMATQKFKHDQHYRAFFSCLPQLSARTKPLASPLRGCSALWVWSLRHGIGILAPRLPHESGSFASGCRRRNDRFFTH